MIVAGTGSGAADIKDIICTYDNFELSDFVSLAEVVSDRNDIKEHGDKRCWSWGADESCVWCGRVRGQ